MKKINFLTVDDENKIEILANKANEIWHEYFPGIISVEQIDYMVDMFLAPHSIKKEIEEGYCFYLAYKEEELIGFMAIQPEDSRLFISKLYIDKNNRGLGYGSCMFEKAVTYAVENGLDSMYLTVNKHNTSSIDVYKHKGFIIVEEVVNDIGNGFVMDDYVMEYRITKKDMAQTYFKMGYNCSQAVTLSFSKEMGIDSEKLLMLSSSFGGGMGRLREVCGAVSGMFMVAGALYGYSNPKAGEEKARHYERIQTLAKEFKEKNGSIVCKELLGVDGVQQPTPDKRTAEYYKKRPCVQMVGDAAEIMEYYIKKC